MRPKKTESLNREVEQLLSGKKSKVITHDVKNKFLVAYDEIRVVCDDTLTCGCPLVKRIEFSKGGKVMFYFDVWCPLDVGTIITISNLNGAYNFEIL